MSEAIRLFRDDFQQLVKQNEHEIAIIVDSAVQEKTITYAQLSELVDRYLEFFENRGLQPGDHILSLLPNSAEAVICFLAALKGGYGYAPLSCFATDREVEKWIQLIQPKFCIKMKEVDFSALASPDLDVFQIACDSSFHWLPTISSRKSPSTAVEPKLFLSTSGTTGEAKAMVLDGNVLWSSGYAFAGFHQLLGKKPRFWNYLPMSYLGGLFNLTLIPLCSSGSIVITESFNGRTLLSFWQTIDRFHIDSIWLVPTIAKGLLKIANTIKNVKHKEKSKRIKTCFLGTAPISLSVKEQFEEMFGIHMLENYALSETTFLTSETLQNIKHRSESSVGQVIPYVQFKLLEQKEEPGACELKVKTPYLFNGYLTSNGEIELELDEEGFFTTGDFGYVDEYGQLILAGRRQDVIKKGGLFVSLKEIELLVESLPQVEEAAAVRIEHDFYGESYDLYVIPTEKGKDVTTELNAWLHQNLVNYKWPEAIHMREEFPRTSTGKIMKNKLAYKGDRSV